MTFMHKGHFRHGRLEVKGHCRGRAQRVQGSRRSAGSVVLEHKMLGQGRWEVR